MKNEFKGTQGEWVADFVNRLESKIETKTHRIAEVKHYSNKIHVIKKEPTLEEGQANAKLIAAAPEMLKALQELLNVDEIDVHSKYKAERNAQQAINKALKL
jgi:hypothetical protein